MSIENASREDIIWLAGLLEGEGTFDSQRQRYPRVRLSMTDRDVVGRAATLMGCSIRLTLRPKPLTSTWHAEIQGPRAEAIMRTILPFMGARRSARIAEILSARTVLESPAWSGSAFRSEIARPPGIPTMKQLGAREAVGA